MCGRALWCKGKIGEASRPVQPCVRPVSAVLMTAGLDEVRGSDPNQFFALDGALTPWVVPIPGSDRFVITSQHPCTSRESLYWPVAYAAGTAYVPPRVISAQAIRAVLLASATATTFGRLRSSGLAAHTLPGLAYRANRKTAVAPIARRRRRYPSPCLLIRPGVRSRHCYGTSASAPTRPRTGDRTRTTWRLAHSRRLRSP